jgi:hypothetical protein
MQGRKEGDERVQEEKGLARDGTRWPSGVRSTQPLSDDPDLCVPSCCAGMHVGATLVVAPLCEPVSLPPLPGPSGWDAPGTGGPAAPAAPALSLPFLPLHILYPAAYSPRLQQLPSVSRRRRRYLTGFRGCRGRSPMRLRLEWRKAPSTCCV